MTPEIQALLDIIQQVGLWAIFAWLYVQEKRDHAETRRNLYAQLEAAKSSHMADIREIAGMRQNLYSLNPQNSVPRDPPRLREERGISGLPEVSERDK